MYEEGGSDVLPSLVKYKFLIIHPVQILLQANALICYNLAAQL